MRVTLPAVPNGAPIPAEHAFCVEDGKGKAGLGPNKSPELRWEGAPAGTRSFVVLVTDPKVPSKADDVNKDGRAISKDLPRVNFYHWALADLPPTLTHLPAGAESAGVTPRGKPAAGEGAGGVGGVRGLNNYTDWFASDEAMKGAYAGYDGPCPPWNDELIHEYRFEVFALNVPTLSLPAGFKPAELLKAMEGRVLARGVSVGLYRLNPAVPYPPAAPPAP
ncbi:MAG: YbhB/YbcL family Raf kinase inhibitor-like protein [Deltaproteobacteria bacterium]|nr:YbhB/YbcL family Raf kinase inhibitor-like protein [Deltaproteobacteria bacterium]